MILNLMSTPRLGLSSFPPEAGKCFRLVIRAMAPFDRRYRRTLPRLGSTDRPGLTRQLQHQ
jgi:hypothetical protein